MYYERLMQVTGLTKQAGMEKQALSPQFLARMARHAMNTKSPDRAARFIGLLDGTAGNPAFLERWMENGQNMNLMQKAFMRGKLHSAYTNAVPAEGALRILNNPNAPNAGATQQHLRYLKDNFAKDYSRGVTRGSREYYPERYRKFIDHPYNSALQESRVVDGKVVPPFYDGGYVPSALQRATDEMSDAAMTNPALWS